MKRWFPVRASRLHARELVCGDSTVRQATLFPFFDRSGAVEHVLIVDAESSVLRTLTLNATRVSIPLWGPIRIDRQILRLNEDVIAQLAPLWHYDPLWLLRDARFDDQAEIPILKLTNCAESFHHQPSDVLFSGRLTNVGRIVFRSSALEYESKRFRADMLPSREPVRSPAAETRGAGWQLVPIWHQRTRK